MFLTDSADISRIHVSSKLNRQQRDELGQFLTPAAIARFMAKQFNNLSEHIHLLDPGAGIGTLTAAFVEQILAKPEKIKSCLITAYEIESSFIPELKQCLDECCMALEKKGIQANYRLQQKSFLESSGQLNSSFIKNLPVHFTHAILNPPYKKVNNQSVENQILLQNGIKTVNLYSAFVWLAMLQLSEDGEMVAITPRSFCNGSYYRPFRQALLENMQLQKIHIFESRSTVFLDDDILQENIIFNAIKNSKKTDYIEITKSLNGETEESLKFPYQQIIDFDNPENFIYIITDSFGSALKKQMEQFSFSLDQLDIKVSTGPVVDFRLKFALKNCIDPQTVPLFYPETIQSNTVIFPPKNPRKPIAIENNQKTKKWLIQSGWYVLIKRFTAKEEKRRIVAATCSPCNFPFIGIENHLNYYHAKGESLNPNLARGLTAFLNSTLFDLYFRQFSGHTQVNATDLRRIKYPSKDLLIKLGSQTENVDLTQTQLDILVHETLSIMKEAIDAVHAVQRIEEALDILKRISAPKEQQNERSALCLLALANIEPNTSWNQASSPKRRITEMMDWFRDYYGKQYAPNTRETVRRQTMHQFVQMGIVIENPDQPDRPINSPKWCYQLHPQVLSLLQSYNTDQWENALQNYSISITNLLQARSRNIAMIPVSLPDGQAIQLSSGGQNVLIKAVLESFCPRFTPGGLVLYVGDAGDKFIINKTQQFREIGLELDPHGKMPDLVIYHQQKDWLVLIEAVTSHGPVNLKRHNELKSLFGASRKGLVFVTAFPSRKDMARYLAEISWETEVWVADQADHLIHFNGERFLGPYETPQNFS